jgi:hypothetical protein
MDLSRSSGRVRDSVAHYRRDLVTRIVNQTVADLAEEKGITPEAKRRWSQLVARAKKTASTLEKTLPPAREVPEIEIESLRPFARQPIQIRILGSEEASEAEVPEQDP